MYFFRSQNGIFTDGVSFICLYISLNYTSDEMMLGKSLPSTAELNIKISSITSYYSIQNPNSLMLSAISDPRPYGFGADTSSDCFFVVMMKQHSLSECTHGEGCTLAPHVPGRVPVCSTAWPASSHSPHNVLQVPGHSHLTWNDLLNVSHSCWGVNALRNGPMFVICTTVSPRTGTVPGT